MIKDRKFGLGQPAPRLEDRRFLKGEGRFVADIARNGAMAAGFLRSQHGHARFEIGDLEAARALTGVRAVYVAADMSHLGNLECLWPIPNADGTQTPPKPFPIMAADQVFHEGDVVAMVVADTPESVEDALELIDVDWSPLPAVVDMDRAMKPDAPQLFEGAPGNVAYDTHFGDRDKVDRAFEAAHKVVRIRVVNNRVVANYIETCGCLANWDAPSQSFDVHITSQGVHGFRDNFADRIFGLPRGKIRIRTGDVGGGFGTKTILYREYVLVMEAARQLGMPVRWISNRYEHFASDAQGRDNLTGAEMALDAQGRFLAMRLDVLGNLGGYASQFGPAVAYVGTSMATGAYDIPALFARVRGVYTNTVPTDAYRGAGNPEATYVLERLVDACARAMDLTPMEIRQTNVVRPAQMPYSTAGTDRTYDVGDFGGTLSACLKLADHAGFPKRETQSATSGVLRGFGIAGYVECTAWGDGETGSVELNEDGDFTLRIGTQSSGQGHETAYAQLAAAQLDVEVAGIRVVQGDTRHVKTGVGTGGSRSIPVGAVMVNRATSGLVTKLRIAAGRILGTPVGELIIQGGAIGVEATNRWLSYREIAQQARQDERFCEASFAPPDATYPNGTHCCEVTFDPETCALQVVRYSVVDDFGVTLNPLLLEGQIHGGVAQGLGQALMERMAYHDDGMMAGPTLLDYALPRANDFPMPKIETRNIPSTTNPLGLKGAGEAGTVCAPAAVINAVIDMLWRNYGIDHIDMPATPGALFDAIHKGSVPAAKPS